MPKKKCWKSKGFAKGHAFYKQQSSTTDLDHPSEGADGACDERKWPQRMSAEDYALVVKKAADGTISTPDVDGTNSTIHVLRPKPKSADETMAKYLEGDGKGEMRIVHMDKMVAMFNHSIQHHQSTVGTSCDLPQFCIAKEIKKGVCWKMALRCKNCKYTSGKFKLYEEVESNGKRGPKFAKPNLGLQVGLQETPISKSQAMVILACMNTPPPCSSSLQRAANKVGDMTSMAAEQDLQGRRDKVKTINKLRGLPEDAPINVSIDVRYNSNTIASRNKMGQNASQATATCIENQTDEKQIIGISMLNKLCHKGAILRSKGKKVKCPGHPGCTANQKSVVPFSEYQLGKNLGEDMARQGVRVKYATTDADARSAAGVNDAMMAKDDSWKVERQADTTHHSQSLYRQVCKAKFSDGMFPGENKAIRTRQQQMFARDVKHRCRRIFNDMYRKAAGSLATLEKRMPATIDATIECYSGNCDNCRKHSVVCKGGKKSWRLKSKSLAGCNATELQLTDEDKATLKTLLNFDLGKKALNLKKTNCNTNRCEAANRSLSASDPKNVNYSRNGKARALAAVSRLNKGKGKSLIDFLEVVGSSVSKGGRVAKSFDQLQKVHKYYKLRSQSKKAMSQRTRRMLSQMDEFLAAKNDPQSSDYRKGQLDPEIDLPVIVKALRKSVRLDHAYEMQNV